MPPFPPATEWIGEAPPAVEKLTARGPVLVHFADLGHAASVRTLPYLAAWHERYSAAGLRVLGVNSPRFAFTAEPAKLAAALARLEVPFPVAADSGFAIWRDYGCEGWPSSFLWARGGVLHWFQFGEGEYRPTEDEIRSLLPEAAREAGLPGPVEPLRPSDRPGAAVMPPTAELYPGGDVGRPWRVGAGDRPLEAAYGGAGVAVTVDGEGELEVAIDGGPPRTVDVNAPGVYEVAVHERHGSHRLSLRPSPGLEVWAVAFSPGVP